MDAKPFVYLAIADQAWFARQREHLLAEFELNVFHCVADCRQALAQRQPDALVLDTALPDADVFSLHRELRDDFDTGDIPQLLLCTTEEAGSDQLVADDFVIRPCADAVLSNKLRQLKKLLIARLATRDQMAYAQKVAMTAMCSMGDLGVVMEFMTRSFACRTIQSVGELAARIIGQYELSALIYFVWEGDSYTVATEGGSVADADRDLLAMVRPLGRMLELNGQQVFNFDHVTVLIRQMPDDAERCGRIRDNIATLCEGIESRLTALLLEHDNLLKQQGIRYAVCEIRDSVADLYQRQLVDVASGREMISEVTEHFEQAFLHLALAPALENQMVGLLVELRQELADIWARPSEVEDRLKRVIASLETLAGEVGELEARPG